MLVFKIKIKLNKFKSDYWAQDTKGCVTNTKVLYPFFRLKIPTSVLKMTVVSSLVNIRFVEIIAHIGIRRVGIWNPSLENLVQWNLAIVNLLLSPNFFTIARFFTIEGFYDFHFLTNCYIFQCVFICRVLFIAS